MDNAKYCEAAKAVNSIKKEDGYMVINMGYSLKLLVPHKDGLAIMAALNFAEAFEDPYSSSPTISPLMHDKVGITTMSAVEYRQHKIAALLNVPVKDIQEHEKQAA